MAIREYSWELLLLLAWRRCSRLRTALAEPLRPAAVASSRLLPALAGGRRPAVGRLLADRPALLVEALELVERERFEPARRSSLASTLSMS